MKNSIFTADELSQWNILKDACKNDPDTFKILLSTAPDNVLNGVVNNTNLLFIACRSQSESAKHLLECSRFTDKSINAIDDNRQTVLHVACAYQHEAVKHLSESKRLLNAYINRLDKNGNTPLQIACIYNGERKDDDDDKDMDDPLTPVQNNNLDLEDAIFKQSVTQHEQDMLKIKHELIEIRQSIANACANANANANANMHAHAHAQTQRKTRT